MNGIPGVRGFPGLVFVYYLSEKHSLYIKCLNRPNITLTFSGEQGLNGYPGPNGEEGKFQMNIFAIIPLNLKTKGNLMSLNISGLSGIPGKQGKAGFNGLQGPPGLNGTFQSITQATNMMLLTMRL